MYPSRIVFRFQLALALASAVLGVLFFLFFYPLARQVAGLDPILTTTWDRIFEINLRNKAKLGMDLRAMTKSLDLAEKSVQAVHGASQNIKERIELEPDIRDWMAQPFQLIDYDQRRLQLIADLQRTAAAAGTKVNPSVLKGFPEFLKGKENPGFLWAQLSLYHQAVSAAVAQRPSAIRSAMVLPVVFHAGVGESKAGWAEIPIRLELSGSMEAAYKVLMSVPLRGGEMQTNGLGECNAAKPAMFINKFVINATTNGNEVELDAIVSGFVGQEQLP
jgi:hypothetical protein